MRRAIATALAALLAVALTGCNNPITVLTPAPDPSLWTPPAASPTPTSTPSGKATPSGKPAPTPARSTKE